MAACNVAVIGGGIVGLATARALLRERDLSLALFEAEERLAGHQTGHNSGVIHSGLYYRPGSLKAQNCVRGREAMVRFCRERDIPHQTCGKLVVAKSADELGPLRELERRGLANGLAGLERLDAAGLRVREPHVRGIEGLWVPETGIVDFARVARALAAEVTERGGQIHTGARVSAVVRRPHSFVLRHAAGEVEARGLVNCAGLYADRVARMCGVDPRLSIIPFRGEYLEVSAPSADLVRHLIYPVPDPRFPFLGVHFTRTIHGEVEAGPNAVLALHREGYRRRSVSARDAIDIFTYPGFWRLSCRYWRTGMGEVWRSLSRTAAVRELRRLVPELASGDVKRAGAGVRAQAVARDGRLVDDFHIVEAERMLHVINAPSPAATASISIGEHLAARALAVLA